VYLDDKQITDTLSRRRAVADTIVFEDLYRDVRFALLAGVDFMHVQVSPASDPHFSLHEDRDRQTR
jgi:hypothetical protein